MATLVSPGVDVTVTDESFFIPHAAPTVPLIFIATQDEKLRPDGESAAEGTYESNVVRTVTSTKQSTDLYGIPIFLEDASGYQFHGDARNEYGLFALNQFLGVGNRAYVIRANVNLNDNLDDVRALWDRKFIEAQVTIDELVNGAINMYNEENGLNPSDPDWKITVTPTEFLSLAAAATESIFDMYSFRSLFNFWYDDQSDFPLPVYPDGYDKPQACSYYGLTYIANNIAANPQYPGGSVVPGEFSPQEARDLLMASADDFKFTYEFYNGTSLGANDAARRLSIKTALQESINSNHDIRSENFEFNLILAPGYPEVVDELLALSVDVKEEAFVIADCPVDRDPDGITNPSTGWSATSARQRSVHVAYYYPWGLASNLDGVDVVVAPCGLALRTYAYSDNVSFLWFAPAGLRRGIITGVSGLGYVEGVLGYPTKFIEVLLDQGQRDAMYEYAPSGDLNPHVFFPGRGFVVWGQKTSAPAASAMDRVNVSRLIKYIKRQLRKHTLSYVFEPNDQITRDSLKATVDNFLKDLVVKRGLYDYVTVCDESNNTPDRIDRNEMYVDVALKPVKAAEFIYIPIKIVTTGASYFTTSAGTTESFGQNA
jgi:hypothetical protein